MNDTQNVKEALNLWMKGLDSGDLAAMLATTDPEAVICNEHQPTGHGLEAVRQKYGPIIENFDIESGFDIEHLKIYGDFAILVGFFTNKATHKQSGEIKQGQGRLILAYRRHEDGTWKMLLDVDNNDEKS